MAVASAVVAAVTAAGASAVGAVAVAVVQPRRPDIAVKHRIFIAREQYKVSCAHMTVFPDGSKERLHGHNYAIGLSVELDRVDLGSMIAFAPLKEALGELCATWKERVLLAAHNPHFVVARADDREVDFTLCGDHYVLPRGDVLLLPIDNISVEALAAHVAGLLRDKIAALSNGHILGFEVTVAESPGQGASCALGLR